MSGGCPDRHPDSSYRNRPVLGPEELADVFFIEGIDHAARSVDRALDHQDPTGVFEQLGVQARTSGAQSGRNLRSERLAFRAGPARSQVLSGDGVAFSIVSVDVATSSRSILMT